MEPHYELNSMKTLLKRVSLNCRPVMAEQFDEESLVENGFVLFTRENLSEEMSVKLTVC